MTEQVVHLENEFIEVGILPECGASLVYFRTKGQKLFDIMRPASQTAISKKDALGMSMFPMIPYAFRIKGGEFTYWGIKRLVPVNHSGFTDPIHGDGWRSKWDIVAQDKTSVTLALAHDKETDKGYPFSYKASITYALKDKTLDELKDNKELQNIKTSYENTTSLIQLLQANNSALEESLKTFESTSTSINDLIKTLEYIKGKTSYLEENITKVTEGVSAMDEKGSDLVAGVEELSKGIAYLNEGITKFNDEGINKVSGLVNTNLKKTTSRLKALINLGNNYNSFDDSNNIETSTKFVMVVDSVKAPTPKKDTVKEVKKESFWDRIINLFK